MNMSPIDFVRKFSAMGHQPFTAEELLAAEAARLIGCHGPNLTYQLTELGVSLLETRPSPAFWQAVLNPQARDILDKVAVAAKPERDPHGKDPHQTGAKLDAGKVRLGLVLGAFANALVEVGKVGTYGAQKYTDNGWLDVPNGEARYTDALLRHIFAETNEPNDPDTDLRHAAHAAWNALARLELMIRKDKPCK